MQYDATFTNEKTMVTGLVYKSGNPCGGYAAQLRDDDSGEHLPFSTHGVSFERACELARKWAGVE
jgi:hypothetical protein